jgi:hypothetical protein
MWKEKRTRRTGGAHLFGVRWVERHVPSELVGAVLVALGVVQAQAALPQHRPVPRVIQREHLDARTHARRGLSPDSK